MDKIKYLRITTVPQSLSLLLEGQPEFLRKHNFDVHLASSGVCPKELLDYPFLSLPLTRTINPLKDIQSILTLIRFLKRERIQIIHSHTPKAGLIAMISSKLAKTPVRLHTVAGLPQDHSTILQKVILGITERITYLCSNKVYFNSKEQLKSQALIFPRLSSKFDIIHNGTSNGIDVKKFDLVKPRVQVKSRLNIDSEKFIWIFIGRIHRHKGIIELIDAFNTFDRFHPNRTLLYIVGNVDDSRTDLNAEWTKKIQRRNPAIHFVGFQKNVQDWLHASDCLIFPSYREGFPNVPLQAAVVGKPIIATNINGCNEIISDGINGLLVPVQKADPIVDAMEIVYNNDDLRTSMGHWSKNNISKKYERRDFHQKLLKEYNSLIDQI